jgi:hypothetical protein
MNKHLANVVAFRKPLEALRRDEIVLRDCGINGQFVRLRD